MDWHKHLTDSERERLAEIEQLREDLTKEHRRIYDRCRKRTRQALDAVERKTSAGHAYIVDASDAELIAPYLWHSVCHTLKGGKTRPPYIQANIDGRRVYLHRFLMGEPVGFVVDHIDGDPLNNCRSNLRIVTHRENARAYQALAPSERRP